MPRIDKESRKQYNAEQYKKKKDSKINNKLTPNPQLLTHTYIPTQPITYNPPFDINYTDGKIYKIIPKEGGDDGDVYVGSTVQTLQKRFREHRKVHFSKQTLSNYSSSALFKKYGIDNCKIVLIENVNATNKDELLDKEYYYIKNIQCINLRCGNIKNMDRTQQKLKNKNYYIKRKEKTASFLLKQRIEILAPILAEMLSKINAKV